MKFQNFVRRDDLCPKGVSSVRYSKDEGYLVLRTKKGWYATNDTRLELVGAVPNKDLCNPTLGPFKTAQEAFKAYSEEGIRCQP